MVGEDHKGEAMTKYPKAWMAAADPSPEPAGRNEVEYYSAAQILDALDAVGALKPVPKPREFYLCPCGNSVLAGDIMRDMKVRTCTHFGEFPYAKDCLIHVREVEDSDDR